VVTLLCETAAAFLHRSGPNQGGLIMAVYMVDRELKGITMAQLADAQRRAIETGEKFTVQGKPVRYIRSTFVPGESRCMCLFEAPNPELVKEVNEAAEIPFSRIVEALDLTP
jgi:hypothetical protein